MDRHVEYSLQAYSSIAKRPLIPLQRAPGANFVEPPGGLPDPKNVQGDVVYLFSKTAADFLFFKINNVSAFTTALANFKPTSSKDIQDLLDKANKSKQQNANSPRIDQAQFQIAFSRAGLTALGVTQGTGDARFDTTSMLQDKKFLGDQRTWDEPFQTGGLHGVITIGGNSPETCTKGFNDVKQLFGSSITVAGGKPVEGRARPGNMKGHEHFGYMDGVSQPAMRGVVAPHRGQIQVDPGVILMGYKGDPVLEDPNNTTKRPAWTKDGTMLVFRKLEQDVLLFDWFEDQNLNLMRSFLSARSDAPRDLTDQEVKDLFGARLIGRWKSGAPIAVCPYRDSPKIAADPEKNNDFDYVIRDDPKISPLFPSDYRCPFTAHVRKTAPRNLDPFVSQKYLESGSIIRAGLPYGPEVSDEERRKFDPTKLTPSPRGLIFTCYASNLDEGFVRQTKAYADNNYFPTASFQRVKHGQDPVLGSPDKTVDVQFIGGLSEPDLKPSEDVDLIVRNASKKISVAGLANVNPAPQPGDNNPFFVTSRGGEYFFVPSIPTLKSWAKSISIQSSPSSSGTYRIKLVDQNLYIESIPSPNNPGLKLASLDKANAKQNWILNKASQTNAWTITSADNNWGLTYSRNQNSYWGYGYPFPQNSPSLTWTIIPQTSEGKSFSKIKLLNDPQSYCFDSVSAGSDAVHFYYDQQTYVRALSSFYFTLLIVAV
ncbi:hypothetical protein APHAL10511_005844 [Amanita phalloides]|nr:hypothetical protein APHAL10511_005844 [Amanita phalloides]